MPQRTAPTKERPKPPLPRWLFKLVNPTLSLVLRSPLHGKASGVLMLLGFTGRKSGRRYATPVGYHAEGGDLLVFTHSPWWTNMRGGARVTMRLRGRDVPGWAIATTDLEEIFPRVRAFVDRKGARNARRIGLSLPPDRSPSDDELRAAIRDQGLARIRIRPGATGPA